MSRKIKGKKIERFVDIAALYKLTLVVSIKRTMFKEHVRLHRSSRLKLQLYANALKDRMTAHFQKKNHFGAGFGNGITRFWIFLLYKMRFVT